VLVFLLAKATRLAQFLSEPRGFAEENHEHAGGKRIECSRVADATLVKDVTRPRDNIVRRDSGGLVDY